MNYDDLLKNMDHATYRAFRLALELGKWPDGRLLSPAQRETCMEAALRFETLHGIDARDRIGYIERDRPTSCESGDDHHHHDDDDDHHDDEPAPIRWVDGKPQS